MAEYKIPILASGLSASQAIMTDADKKLISVDYLDQAVKTTSSPTFANATISGLLNLAAGSSSYITKNSERFLHDTGTLNNVFLGRNAGTLTNTGSQNLGIGKRSGS